MSWYRNWLERHQHPASLVLHGMGIPMAIASVVLALVQLRAERWDLWWRPVVLLVAGYVLQWIGHLIEGNDMGEWILVKKMLGRDFVSVSARYKRDEGEGGG